MGKGLSINMEVLRVENVTKAFGGVMAIQDVSFSVEKGERLAIIGPNGAGKTTLLKMLSGELDVTHGRIALFNQEITKIPNYKRVRHGMALSFQITSLFNSLTVLENLLLAILSTKSLRNKIFKPITDYRELYEKAEDILDSMDLLGKKHEAISEMSHGEQRKLEIALSLASEPKLLLLDEPNSGLTTAEGKDISRLVRGLGRDVTVLIVAHDMGLVFDVAERIICLHYGRVIADGTCMEIRDNPQVRDVYMGLGRGMQNA